MWIRNHFYMIRQKLLLTHLCVSSQRRCSGTFFAGDLAPVLPQSIPNS